MNGEVIIKAKGVNSDSLTKEDFKKMYLDSQNALVSKTVSVTDYSRGSVLIDTKNVIIKWDSFNKRSKIINPSSKL
jgi:hypothetical protein